MVPKAREVGSQQGWVALEEGGGVYRAGIGDTERPAWEGLNCSAQLSLVGRTLSVPPFYKVLAGLQPG